MISVSKNSQPPKTFLSLVGLTKWSFHPLLSFFLSPDFSRPLSFSSLRLFSSFLLPFSCLLDPFSFFGFSSLLFLFFFPFHFFLFFLFSFFLVPLFLFFNLFLLLFFLLLFLSLSFSSAFILFSSSLSPSPLPLSFFFPPPSFDCFLRLVSFPQLRLTSSLLHNSS